MSKPQGHYVKWNSLDARWILDERWILYDTTLMRYPEFIQINLHEIPETVVFQHLQYFCFGRLNAIPGELCVCFIPVSVIEMTMWLCPHFHALHVNFISVKTFPLISQCAWLCKLSVVLISWGMKLGRGKWLSDACMLSPVMCPKGHFLLCNDDIGNKF